MNNPTRFSNQYYRLLSSLEWKKKKLPNGVEQFINYDEDSETELMMLPTDMALRSDLAFSPWIKRYAEDKDAFFKDFATVFAKLLELGIERDVEGRITNTDNKRGGYHAAPKKKSSPSDPERTSDDKTDANEAEPLAEGNKKFRARL